MSTEPAAAELRRVTSVFAPVMAPCSLEPVPVPDTVNQGRLFNICLGTEMELCSKIGQTRAASFVAALTNVAAAEVSSESK